MSTTMPETATATEAATAQTTEATATATEAAAQTQAGTATQTAAQTAAEAPAAEAGKAEEWDGKVESLPPAAQKIITDLRKEAGDERVAKKTLEAIQKALNPDAETKVDPVKLAADHVALTGNHTGLQREHQVLLSAIEAGADHKALLDSRSFLAKVNGLDPAADDFAAKVDAEIASALKDNPKLKAARAAGQSSVDHAGGSGENHTLDAQIAEAEKAGNHALAISLKRQKAYTPTA